MILLIDNYDSFVYNLARYVGELGFAHLVKRNNKITLADIIQLKPSHIIISPGPGTPNDAGISREIIAKLGEKTPILGVCLGHQAIGQVYGGKVIKAHQPMHGKSSLVKHNENGIFSKLPNPLTVGRYHSLIVSEENFPNELTITARCVQNQIMALQHRTFPVFGVQFHPESVLSELGHELLRNFLEFNA